MTRRCAVCGVAIPAGRVRALPGTTTCVDHSDAVARTEADVEVDGSDNEDMRRATFAPAGEKSR